MLRFVLILILTASFVPAALAQEVEVTADTVHIANDSLVVSKRGKIINIHDYAHRFQPRKAILYAAILPGMGQIYNKKYWKLPIVYGGFGIITAFAVAYDQLNTKYKNQLFLVLAGNTSASAFTEVQLRTIIDTYRRQRDFFLILDGFWYMLQLVDAHVDAHLKEFDLNPKLKLSFRPTVQQNELTGRISGMSLTLTF